MPRQHYNGLYYISRSNRKTGYAVGVAVGRTLEQTRDSCQGCALLNSKKCYAWNGSPHLGLLSHLRANQPERYQLDNLLKRLDRMKWPPRIVRFGTIGDPARITHDELHRALAAFTERRLEILGYTHHWREPPNQWLKKWFLASCDTLDEVDHAIAHGWKPTAIVPHDHPDKPTFTPRGHRTLVCPAQTGWQTCATCRKCSTRTNLPAILFRDERPTINV